MINYIVCIIRTTNELRLASGKAGARNHGRKCGICIGISPLISQHQAHQQGSMLYRPILPIHAGCHHTDWNWIFLR